MQEDLPSHVRLTIKKSRYKEVAYHLHAMPYDTLTVELRSRLNPQIGVIASGTLPRGVTHACAPVMHWIIGLDIQKLWEAARSFSLLIPDPSSCTYQPWGSAVRMYLW